MRRASGRAPAGSAATAREPARPARPGGTASAGSRRLRCRGPRHDPRATRPRSASAPGPGGRRRPSPGRPRRRALPAGPGRARPRRSRRAPPDRAPRARRTRRRRPCPRGAGRSPRSRRAVDDPRPPAPSSLAPRHVHLLFGQSRADRGPHRRLPPRMPQSHNSGITALRPCYCPRRTKRAADRSRAEREPGHARYAGDDIGWSRSLRVCARRVWAVGLRGRNQRARTRRCSVSASLTTRFPDPRRVPAVVAAFACDDSRQRNSAPTFAPVHARARGRPAATTRSFPRSGRRPRPPRADRRQPLLARVQAGGFEVRRRQRPWIQVPGNGRYRV